MYDQTKIGLPPWLQQQWAHHSDPPGRPVRNRIESSVFSRRQSSQPKEKEGCTETTHPFRETDTNLRASNNYSHTKKKKIEIGGYRGVDLGIEIMGCEGTKRGYHTQNIPSFFLEHHS